MSGDEVDWKPCQPLAVGATGTAIVTKKGGVGDPSLTIVETQFKPTFGGSLSAPVSVPIAVGALWQLNYTWDFSPNYYTYLDIAYKSDSTCSFESAQFSVTLPNGISKIGNYCFNTESVSSNATGTVTITNLSSSTSAQHILLKLFVGPPISVGDRILIGVSSNLCGPTVSSLALTAKTVPHDPNQKTVDIKRICDKKKSTKLHYRVQFHNDGKAPVKKVQVTDCLPGELIPNSFILTQAPTMNGLTTPFINTSSLNNPCKTLEFNGLGLPGLGQTNYAYLYSQTIYAFEFDVMTTANLTKDIDNVAVITFFDDDANLSKSTFTALTPITTNVERVYVGCEKPSFCHCLRMLFCRKRNRPQP